MLKKTKKDIQKRQSTLQKWLKRLEFELCNARREQAHPDCLEGLHHQIGYITGELAFIKWMQEK